MLVEDHEGDLRGSWRGGLRRWDDVAPNPDDPLVFALPKSRYERHVPFEVELREPSELAVGELLLWCKESEVDGSRAEMLGELPQPFLIGGTDGANVHRPSVAEELFRKIVGGG